jgi:heme-degrading monooxygenase HmoA
MILTVFRSRLKPGDPGPYDSTVDQTVALAELAPGFIGHKLFTAEDGERITIVEFESMETQRAWSLSQEHKLAAITGRRQFYSEYKIQICEVLRESVFTAPAPAASPS